MALAQRSDGQDQRDAVAFGYRPALDGVRALAVTAVLLFHSGVSWLPGGFLGVDAFFVLSGFLITSLLLAERARTGRIQLVAFWVRRARRLLPALLVLLVVVVLAYRDLLSDEERALLRTDALSALGYVANWRMTYRGGGDYFAQEARPSPLQHTWSLGIEEQFYLFWPLVVLAILALGLARGRAVLCWLCLAATAASAVAAAVLYQPHDVNRAYLGTDTRSQALLVGAALAALLPASGPARPAAAPWYHRVVAATAGGALLGVGWLWSHAHGTDGWLYHGGLTAGALAVAAVIAHTMLSPGSPVTRALSLPPLVWLGTVSYGVYLWHWPLFGILNGDRTGLTGSPLLALRLAATLLAAWLSFVLVEQPIRTGRLPLHQLVPAVRGRPGRLMTGVAATGAVLAVVLTAGVIVAATGAASREAAPVAVPAVVPLPVPPRLPPTQRLGRLPGTLPRVTFFGDSVSWTLGTYLPEQPDLAVTVRSVQGCGIARLPDVIQLGTLHSNYPACPSWDVRWRRGIEVDDPDVSVILLDRWELMDRKIGDTYYHVGQPEYDAYLTSELELAVSIAGSRGAHVVLLTAPYTRRAERPDGGLYDEDLPERVDAWNRLLRTMAAGNPEQVTVLDLNKRVCPDGAFTWRIGRLRIRSDGLHFTPDGVRQWIAPWLMPQLAAIANGSAYAVQRGD